MILYDVPAPAKLNLFLHILGRRADGYHLLETVFRFIDLCDMLHFERRTDGVLSCDSPIPGLSADQDLVLRAARLLQQVTGTRYGAHIAYEKSIPTGAGLGGGSSDAATTLIALNRLWDTGMDRGALMRLGVMLGADVPAFVYGRCAFAEGVGEQLREIDLPHAAYVVLHPPVPVSTAAIFGAGELTRNRGSVKMSLFTERQSDWQLSKLFQTFCNDLEPVVRGRYPSVELLAQWLYRQGLKPRMTGSGSCFYVEFPTLLQARDCQREIAGKIPVCVSTNVPLVGSAWACSGLQEHPLRQWVQD